MKKIISFILVLVTILSLSACMSKEETAQIERLEAEAIEYMEDYLDEKYPSFEIEKAEQLVDGNFLEGYQIQDITKLLVKDGTKRYVFCYDKNNDCVYSSVNYDRILSEFEEMLNTDKTLAQSLKSTTLITCYEQKVVLDEHKSLNDVLKFAQKDKYTYTFTSTHYFKEKKNFTPSKFAICNLYDEIYNMEITLYNTVDDFTDTKHNSFEYIDIIKYHDDNYGTDKDRVIMVNHNHNDVKKVDDIIFVYDDRYVDFNVNKTEDYIDENIDKHNTTYSPMYRGYKYEICVEKNEDLTINGFTHDATFTKNGCKVIVTDEYVNRVCMFINAKKYENCVIYEHKDSSFNHVFQFDEYEKFEFYAHSGYKKDIISFMKTEKDVG